MTTGKLCAILKSKRGTAFPLTVAVTLALMLFFCAASEGIRLMIIAQGVRDAVQSAVVSAVNDSYDNVYHGVREGYSGAYQPSKRALITAILTAGWTRCLGLPRRTAIM